MPLTLVALHGNGGGAFRFARVEPFMPLDVRFRPVTLPGFASVPRDPTLTTLRAYAERLRECLEAEPRPRVLLGHGIGGSIALELAQFASTTMDGLILHAPVGARLGSRFFPRVGQLDAFRPLLPGCLVSLPRRWDHFPMIEDPEAYAREVSALARKLAVR